MKRKKYLADIAEIRFGVNARSMDEQGVPFITARNFSRDGRFSEKKVFRIDNRLVKKRDFLKNGEVLFMGKGYRNFSTVWKGWMDHAVASATFFILRPDKEKINSNYLAWYLTSDLSKRYFNRDLKVSTINIINRSRLEKLPVVVPPLEEQEKIVRIFETWQKEKQLINRWTERMELMVNSILVKKLND